jgi:ABC-2 type transport system permease protein
MSAELRVVGFWQRLGVLFRKEVRQIRRDRRLAISLVVPPVLQILLFGFALNSNVTALRLGIQDDSKTPESRELIATLTESKSFRLQNYYFDGKSMDASISRGDLDAGVVIPYDFARDINRKRPTNIQFILNAVDTNTAAIGQGYAEGVIASYNASLAAQGIRAQFRTVAVDGARKGTVNLLPAFLFNPGLITTWFIVTGTLGTLLILNGSLVASTAMIKEREAGTVEQLLMTPAGTAEIIIAKIAPLFGLLALVILLAIGLIRFVFNVPMRGSFLLIFGGAAMCLLCGIGIGTFLATVAKSSQQVMLLTFFINPPLASLSGALAPVEAMPAWLRPMTLLNPIYHFGIITRSVMLKGSTFGELWVYFAALIAFTVVFMGVSVWRFRKQLG